VQRIVRTKLTLYFITADSVVFMILLQQQSLKRQASGFPLEKRDPPARIGDIIVY
jgi:hypothetical protein